MRCPICQSKEVRIAECFELMYEISEHGTPGPMSNDADVFNGPEDHYYCCINCWHRWDIEGQPLRAVFTVPERVDRAKK